jgi:hypothetical protein
VISRMDIPRSAMPAGRRMKLKIGPNARDRLPRQHPARPFSARRS